MKTRKEGIIFVWYNDVTMNPIKCELRHQKIEATTKQHSKQMHDNGRYIVHQRRDEEGTNREEEDF